MNSHHTRARGRLTEDLMRSHARNLAESHNRALSVRLATFHRPRCEAHRWIQAQLELAVVQDGFARLAGIRARYAPTACAAATVGLRVDPIGASRFLLIYACTQGDSGDAVGLAAKYFVESQGNAELGLLLLKRALAIPWHGPGNLLGDLTGPDQEY